MSNLPDYGESDLARHARPLPPMKQSRPARKQMVAILRAASVCLAVASAKEDLKRAIDALSRLSDTDLGHAKEWLAGGGPIEVGISLEHVDKLQAEN